MENAGAQGTADGARGEELESGMDQGHWDRIELWPVRETAEEALQDDLGPRHRKLTERGKEEKINRLKREQTAALKAVTRKRTELSVLMIVFKEYLHACDLHLSELTPGEEMDEEQKHRNAKQRDILSYLNEVAAWITHSEQKLSENLETQSTKGQSSKASSRMSARDKERVKLAELRAEKSMFKQKQALQAAEEDLKLELEIGKAEAREKDLAQMRQEQETSPQHLGSGSQSIASFSPLPKRSHDPLTTLVSSASLANGSIRNHKVPATTTITPMAAERDVTTVTGTSCSPIVSHEGQPLNVGAVEFNPNTFVKGTSSTPYASHGFDIPKENSYGTPESHALKTMERTFQDVMALQQRQNETIIATH